jgi:protein AroM
MKTIAMITIGQSPRHDTVPEMEKVLGPEIHVQQAGALDGLSHAEVTALAPRAGHEHLVTRLRDGRQVIVAKHAILDRLQACLDRLEAQVDAAVIMCTGAFPAFRFSRPVLEPDRILFAVTQAVFAGGRLGVLIPLEEQRESMAARWAPIDARAAIAVASPYAGAQALVGAAEELKRAGVSFIAMSCMGYTQGMGALLRDVAGVPALLPTSLVARIAAEAV